VQKNVLAPGESTVVELIFNTGLTKGKVGKNASILSSDSTSAKLSISFWANVFAPEDTSARLVVHPARIEFDQKTKKIRAELENRGKEEITLKPLSRIADQLKLKIKNDRIAPDQRGVLEFEWKGDFPENDLKKTITFAVDGSTIGRLSVPILVKGTSPQPEPGKAVKPTQQTDPTTLKDVIKPGGKQLDKPAGK